MVLVPNRIRETLGLQANWSNMPVCIIDTTTNISRVPLKRNGNDFPHHTADCHGAFVTSVEICGEMITRSGITVKPILIEFELRWKKTLVVPVKQMERYSEICINHD